MTPGVSQYERRCLPLRRVSPRLFLALIVLALGTACGTGDQGIAPPEFTERTNSIRNATQQVQGRKARIETDLESFLQARRAFFDMPADFWAGVPKDLFKHAAMACINERVGADAEPDTLQWKAAKAMEVGCVVMPLGPLWERTEIGRRDDVASSMRRVDAMRRLRSNLRNMFRRTPNYFSSMRSLIAERRAEVRQIETEVKRRKPEYTDKNYDLAFERAREFRFQLTELEKAVDQLERTVPGASATLETEVEQVYIELAQL